MALVLPPSLMDGQEKTGPAQPFGTTPPTPKTPEDDGYVPYVPGRDDDFNFDDQPYEYDPLYKPSDVPPGAPVTPNYLPTTPPVGPPQTPPFGPPQTPPLGPPQTPPFGPPQTPPLGPVSPAGPPGVPQTPPLYVPVSQGYPPVSPNYLPTTPPLGPPQTPPLAPVSPVGPPPTPPQIQLTAPADPNLGRGVTELNIKNPEKNVKFDMVKKDENKKGGGDNNTKTLLFSIDKVDKDDDKEK